MTTMAMVREFLGQERLAVVGASAAGKGFGTAAYRALKKKGYKLVPVHPSAATIEGDPAFHSLAEIPEPVGGVLVVVPPEQTEKVVEDAIAAGVKRIWMQQGAESERAISRAREAGMQVVSGHCVLMYMEHNGLHGIHRWIWKVIGRQPE